MQSCTTNFQMSKHFIILKYPNSHHISNAVIGLLRYDLEKYIKTQINSLCYS